MVKARLEGIGYCARMTNVGDWAFQFALELARRHDAQLNVFYFASSPYEAHASRGRAGDRLVLSREEDIELERKVRLYYDERLGDYVKVGFRLCPGDEMPEMRRCLFGREYDILVVAYEGSLCSFGECSVEQFAEHMQCPVVLVGPNRPDEIHLNVPAKLWTPELGLEDAQWQLVSGVTA